MAVNLHDILYWLLYFRALENLFDSTEGQKIYSEIDDQVYEKEFEENGIKGIQQKVTDELDKWKHVPVHIAVAGESGCGKSAFINAVRSLSPEDKYAAEEGLEETTYEICPYRHPESDGFIMWDLPGVGTNQFPKEKYLEAIQYEKYDFFIIMYEKRFREIDTWLAKAVRDKNKKFFFVRTHIYQALKQEKKNRPTTFQEEVALDKMRNKCLEEALVAGLKDPKVFLIDNKKKEMFEFGALQDELLSSYDSLKRASDDMKKTTLAFSLSAITTNVMLCKKEALSKRIPIVALAVASSMSEYEEIEKFKAEIEFYQKQFNIDTQQLEENKELMSLTETELKEYRIVFDGHESSGGTSVETPTRTRNAAGRWDRFKDFFVRVFQSKEKWLIYEYCKTALANNLDSMYEQAIKLYGLKMTLNVVASSTN
ncbi:interferon-inducible GTPase 1-like [Mercenaria mercenaria]|uniref:interferon-inducible GTPase 1-like n=1 Tax=Mercenaria mercenaria TaxID=6596 RepID=UPI00234F974D|nr:interferon-inducible GTPase 1-like [Mercenaria mercenaria]